MKSIAARGSLLLPLLFAGCTSQPAKPPAAAHISQADDKQVAAASIPPPVRQTLTPPRPKVAAKTETYSVVVNNVRVHDLLFALARDAKVNIDVHPGIQGTVTLNAVDQTLPQILTRLSKQVDMRWEMDGQNLAVMADSPYLRNYRIDYVNMNRDTTGSVAIAGQINSGVVGGSGSGSGGSGGGGSGNSSTTQIENKSKNRFWDTLIQNIKDLLRETDKVLPEGSSETVVEQEGLVRGGSLLTQAASVLNLAGGGNAAVRGSSGPVASVQSGDTTTVVKRATFREAASVIAHPESGTIAVRATGRQHEKIQEFIDQVMTSAKRQVLIEATIVEVQLSNQYQQGIQWANVARSANATGLFAAQTAAAVTGTGGLFTLTGRAVSGDNSFTAAIQLLETFGTAKVLSSPKISVLNNQPAVLKVVDNQVYFTVKSDTNQNSNVSTTTVTTTPYTVPVGFVMNVTPQISENDSVLLNLRPSISRTIGQGALDPNPELIKLNIENRIPVIRTREMESVLRVDDGQTAVLGGLIEDASEKNDSAIPWFHSIPVVGALFAQKSNQGRKTELVIFLRPTVIRESGMSGDYSRLRNHLPSKDFFNNNKEAPYQLLPADTGDVTK